MNTYKGVVTMAINQEGFGYKYYNLNMQAMYFFKRFFINKVEVEGSQCFISIGIRTILFSLNSAL